ncbi:MAG: glutamate racemase [Magnetococcus sp. WYHC-3]
MVTQPPPPLDPRPIGVFDSGVGGLTVLAALTQRFPEERFIYLGDTARVPYGSKSPRTIERYTIQVAEFLIRRGVKALVVACNTASALGLGALRVHTELPVLGVIQPGCRAAARLMGDAAGVVGIIGTRTTIDSGAYPDNLFLLNPRIRVSALPCPLFVPLVEEGWLDHPATRLIVSDTLEPMRRAAPDVLVLGCTHYPKLAPLIAEALPPHTRLVDSAMSTADELGLLLGPVIAPAPAGHAAAPHSYLVTDSPERFRVVAARFMGQVAPLDVEMVDL